MSDRDSTVFDDETVSAVAAANLAWERTTHGDTFAIDRKRLSRATDAMELGCSLYRIDSGKRAWPFHYHTANEEAMFILDGWGHIRTDGDPIPVEPGTFVSFPSNKGGSHQVINEGDEPLRYLCFSTMNEPDVVIYPDSEKIGLRVGAPPGAPEVERTLDTNLPAGPEMGYWDGENKKEE